MSDASRRPAMAFISFMRKVKGLNPTGGVLADLYGSHGSGLHWRSKNAVRSSGIPAIE